jgi:hypothetical protein
MVGEGHASAVAALLAAVKAQKADESITAPKDADPDPQTFPLQIATL